MTPTERFALKSPTERFIIKAFDGGYTGRVWKTYSTRGGSPVNDSSVLLDPDLWRCAGKALGWEATYETVSGSMRTIGKEDYRQKWHGLLDALDSGATADDYLAGLLTDANVNE
jgi:hypothetical protein